MTREEVICMAEEAGISIGAFGGRYQRQLDRFAAIVAAAEREACAKVCEDMGEFYYAATNAIRKRGEVQP